MSVHCIIYNIKYYSPKIIKYGIEDSVFLFLLDFKMEMKMCFMVLALETLWKFC